MRQQAGRWSDGSSGALAGLTETGSGQSGASRDRRPG